LGHDTANSTRFRLLPGGRRVAQVLAVRSWSQAGATVEAGNPSSAWRGCRRAWGGGFSRSSGGGGFLDDAGKRPISEDPLDDCPYLLPRQPPIAHSDARERDTFDALGLGQSPHSCQRLLNRLVAGAGVPVALLGAEVEHPRPAFILPQPGIAEV